MSASAALASSITLRNGSPNEVGTTKMAAEREAARARWTAPGNAGRSTFLFMRCVLYVTGRSSLLSFFFLKKNLQRAIGALRAPTQAMATPPGQSAGPCSAEGARERHPAGPSSGGGKPAGVPSLVSNRPGGRRHGDGPPPGIQSPHLRGTPWPGELFRSPRGPRTSRRCGGAAAAGGSAGRRRSMLDDRRGSATNASATWPRTSCCSPRRK